MCPFIVRIAILAALASLPLATVACGDDQAHDEAVALLGNVRAANYPGWASPPAFAERTASHTLHSSEVVVFFDSDTEPHHVSLDTCRTYAANNAVPDDEYFRVENSAGHTEWPQGSTFVKEGYDSGGDLAIVAIMEKRADGWFYAEFDGDDGVLFSGEPEICTNCHAGAKDDFIFTGRLSRLCPPPNEL